MLLSDVLKNTEIIKKKKINNFNPLIKGIDFNSKKISKNFIFVAIKGELDDGHKYINEAIKNGAVLIVIEKKGISIRKVVIQRQKANEIGGTNSPPPLAIIKLLDIKIGCKNNKKYGKILLLLIFDEGFINHHKNYQAHKNVNWKNISKTNHH